MNEITGKGVLYVVATPIGNLKDISQRAMETLEGVDLILCEDTRVTKKLLNHYKITTPTSSYHQHSRLRKIDWIIEFLGKGKDIALVSDAGTPGISDPGSQLVDKAYELGAKIVAVPGPSALAAAASVSGFPMDKFLFLGFPPAKKKRKKFFTGIKDMEFPVIIYESPHRILKTLDELASNIVDRRVAVCRELTKKFEVVYRGSAKDIIQQLKKSPLKGEFVVIVGPSRVKAKF